MSAKQVEVQIMGQSYLLGCPEDGESQLRAAVGRVDSAMCKIRDAGKIKARDRIAVLAALNLAFEQNTPAAAPVSSSNTELSQDGSARLVSLLHRLDQTLNQDGQLI
jgi:cell division protein ZapA